MCPDVAFSPHHICLRWPQGNHRDLMQLGVWSSPTDRTVEPSPGTSPQQAKPSCGAPSNLRFFGTVHTAHPHLNHPDLQPWVLASSHGHTVLAKEKMEPELKLNHLSLSYLLPQVPDQHYLSPGPSVRGTPLPAVSWCRPSRSCIVCVFLWLSLPRPGKASLSWACLSPQLDP